MVDEAGIEQFKSSLRGQGISEADISIFEAAGKARAAEKRKEEEAKLFDPETDSSFQEFLAKARFTASQEEGFDLETDPAFLRFKAQEEFKATQKEKEEGSDIEQTAQNIIKGIQTLSDLPQEERTAVATRLRALGFDPKGEESKEDRKQIIGLIEVLKSVKEGAEEVTVGEFAVSKLGLSSSLRRFNRKKKLAGQFLAKLVENNRLSDKDRDFYQEQILNISPIGLQGLKEESINDLMATIIVLAGFNPKDFNLNLPSQIITPDSRIQIRDPETGETGSIDPNELKDAIEGGWELI
ncbi:MAG TPA: hypothetical protein ENI23_16500 [bacterium]|nr:hypothetical protein [bacterium]